MVVFAIDEKVFAGQIHSFRMKVNIEMNLKININSYEYEIANEYIKM